MYITVTNIEAKNVDEVISRFREQGPHMKQVDGYLGLELWRNENHLKSVNKWDNKQVFLRFVESDLFKQLHGGSRKNLKERPQVEQYDGEVIVSM